MRPRLLIITGCAGIAALFVLVWAIRYTSRPSLPVVIVLVLGVVGLAVVPWTRLVAGRLGRDRDAGRQFRAVGRVTMTVAIGGVVVTLTVIGDQETASVFAMLTIFTAGALALLGAVILPWIFLMVTRERTARIRAEERASMAAHLHDSVLQSLTLIHKQTSEPEVRRLARSTERELRAWLFGKPSTADQLVSAVTAVTDEVEDRFAVTVELVLVGDCPMSGPAHAMVGALREALTNAAKHSGVQRVSALVEVSDGEVFALVKDRGCGFSQDVHNGHGMAASITGRMRQHGGSAEIRSAAGEGTEVELRMPV
ncbi:signal transduction histidine kinase [Kibdelosporangium banguiense]|uniref:Signal transduction histidine kinase n=1 Tax=Kibdelosporangium banguiense TaxID=1365924 RepID=A0ABS4U3W2_9PSEU|nr:ATP-binding protein [Kibdelosporangium banguiense]MBP2330893.1 signal transduction histidine kinase [Kibdelosporangium banguiense]